MSMKFNKMVELLEKLKAMPKTEMAEMQEPVIEQVVEEEKPKKKKKKDQAEEQ